MSPGLYRGSPGRRDAQFGKHWARIFHGEGPLSFPKFTLKSCNHGEVIFILLSRKGDRYLVVPTTPKLKIEKPGAEKWNKSKTIPIKKISISCYQILLQEDCPYRTRRLITKYWKWCIFGSSKTALRPLKVNPPL